MSSYKLQSQNFNMKFCDLDLKIIGMSEDSADKNKVIGIGEDSADKNVGPVPVNIPNRNLIHHKIWKL